MDSKAIAQDKSLDGDSIWRRDRLEIEEQWHTALHGETPGLVPTKLPISIPPVRRRAERRES